MPSKPKIPLRSRSIILLQGAFEPSFYDRLKRRRAKNIFVLEGRPDFSASREVCRQLLSRSMTPVVIADNFAGFLFFHNFVKEVWVAYQVEDQQDVLCDVGGLILGVLAQHHRVPLYAASGIHRNRFVGNPLDVCHLNGVRTAPTGTRGYVPLIDLLPKKYVRKIVNL